MGGTAQLAHRPQRGALDRPWRHPEGGADLCLGQVGVVAQDHDGPLPPGELTEGQQHAAALLRWGLDMKEGEIAAVLGIAEKTVSVHLYRVRRKLLLHLGADYPFDDDPPEGASP